MLPSTSLFLRRTQAVSSAAPCLSTTFFSPTRCLLHQRQIHPYRYDQDGNIDVTGSEVMGAYVQTSGQKRASRQYDDGTEIFEDIPDFTEYRDTNVRPIVFTPERPYPLWGVNLDDVGSQYMLESRLNGGKQNPIVPIYPERHGIPEIFAKKLEKEFGVTHLTPVQARAMQHIYGGNDAAICAPTGSGKTFAFCIAALSKLMRDGPPVPNSILILTPSADLCYQTERWLRKMWWYENDERLCLSITEEMSEGSIHAALIGKSKFSSKSRRFLPGGKTVDERPYIMIATPEALLTYCEARKRILQRTQPDRNFTLVPLFPYLSTVIADEVDSVLPPHNDKAPGNILIAKYLTNTKFQAPLQRIFVSATLSATTVNHIRRFLRKSLMAHKSAHLFETELLELQESPNHSRSAAKGMSAENRNDGRGQSTSGSKASFSRLSVPDNVNVEFFSADRFKEQRGVLQKVITRDLPAAQQHSTDTVNDTDDLDSASSPVSQPPQPVTSTSTAISSPLIRALIVLPTSADPIQFTREVLHGLGTVDLSLWSTSGTSDTNGEDGHVDDTSEEAILETRRIIANLPYDQPLPLKYVNDRHRRRIIRGGLASQAEIDEYLFEKNEKALANLQPSSSPTPLPGGATTAPSSPSTGDPRVSFLICSMDSVRGADIPNLTHLFLLSAPENALELAHVVGRVGRMGADGTACVVCPRSSLRHLNQYCDVLGIPFKLHKRFGAVDVNHQRIVAEATGDY